MKQTGTEALCSVCMWPFSPFVPASHLRASLCVSYRETCAAIACMDAAATHYLGFRSRGSWRGERHPTPPRPLPRPDTPLSTPCRGRTWSRRRTMAPRRRFNFWSADTSAWSQRVQQRRKYTLTQDELNVLWWIMSFYQLNDFLFQYSGIFLVSFLQLLNQLCMNLIQ